MEGFDLVHEIGEHEQRGIMLLVVAAVEKDEEVEVDNTRYFDWEKRA